MWWFDMKIQRRSWLQSQARWAMLIVASSMTGCGFALRRAPPMPFQKLMLSGFEAQSGLLQEIRAQFLGSPGTQIVETPDQADVILRAVRDSREQSVLATSAAAQVRTVQLRYRLVAEARNAQGQLLMAPTEIMISRDQDYNESNSLALEQARQQVYRYMQSDIAAQLMQRLARLNPAVPLPPLPAASQRPQSR
jgi:LPS-assembly lipoprotein